MLMVEHRVTEAQMVFLRFIAENPGLHSAEIARRTGTTHHSAGSRIHRLREDGLVTSVETKRGLALSISDAGRRAMERPTRDLAAERRENLEYGKRKTKLLRVKGGPIEWDPVERKEYEITSAAERPRTRGECVNGPRPCPWVSCKHHLYADVSPSTGAIKLNFPGVDVSELTCSCALDVADAGGVTLEAVGSLMGVTRERIRQVEERGLRNALVAAVDAGITDPSMTYGSQWNEDG